MKSIYSEYPENYNNKINEKEAKAKNNNANNLASKIKMKKKAFELVDKNKEKQLDPKYKTELCKTFEDKKICPYGNSCRFAHGKTDLLVPIEENPKFRVKVCNSFHNDGICMYGQRCHFKHEKQSLENVKRLYYIPLIQASSFSSSLLANLNSLDNCNLSTFEKFQVPQTKKSTESTSSATTSINEMLSSNVNNLNNVNSLNNLNSNIVNKEASKSSNNYNYNHIVNNNLNNKQSLNNGNSLRLKVFEEITNNSNKDFFGFHNYSKKLNDGIRIANPNSSIYGNFNKSLTKEESKIKDTIEVDLNRKTSSLNSSALTIDSESVEVRNNNSQQINEVYINYNKYCYLLASISQSCFNIKA